MDVRLRCQRLLARIVAALQPPRCEELQACDGKEHREQGSEKRCAIAETRSVHVAMRVGVVSCSFRRHTLTRLFAPVVRGLSRHFDMSLFIADDGTDSSIGVDAVTEWLTACTASRLSGSRVEECRARGL